MVLSLDCHKTI